MINMLVQQEIGAVLTYYDNGYKSKNICGATIGADGRGNKAVVFMGDPFTAEKAARKYIHDLQQVSRSKMTGACLVVNGEKSTVVPVHIIDLRMDRNHTLLPESFVDSELD